jgi:hypothetical protein
VENDVCVPCKACNANELESVACTNTTNTQCLACDVGNETRKPKGGAETCGECPAGKADTDEDSGTPCIAGLGTTSTRAVLVVF